MGGLTQFAISSHMKHLNTMYSVLKHKLMLLHLQIDNLSATVSALVSGHMTWEDVISKYPEFTGQEATQ